MTYRIRSKRITYSITKLSGPDMPGNNQKDYYHTPITRLPGYDMLRRSIHQPAASLKEKNFNNLR
ncbi:MAG: hypothetical protein IPI69_02245 [Bacteroidales bacterium]|nr:hypothetical protein [Bacteroidales bacterium]MDI9553745.1 hypothetical protein [Bacteroidota bacterium]